VDDEHKKLFDEAKKVLNKGVDGDKNAAISAFEKFSIFRKAYPDSALIEAYYGSAVALLARDAIHPLDKADKAQEGLDALDLAVSKDPNQKEIRLLRASVCVKLPESYFQRSITAIEDFNFLLNLYQKDPSSLSNKQVTEILKNLAAAYQNVGKLIEAKAILQLLSQVNGKKNNG
jgi:tetratricopeptide (TPR) repeat protein